MRRLVDLYRLLRYGPALYRSARALGALPTDALALVLWPLETESGFRKKYKP